jgi:hypothetical protein
MPQLDKVTFLSQFFWLCVVFFSLYLVLVKLFLPSLARIVKVRQALAATDSGEIQTEGSSNSPAEFYSKSLQTSMRAFQAHSSFLKNWGSKNLSTLVPTISPNFEKDLVSIRSEALLAEDLLNEAIPTISRSPIVEETDFYTKWNDAVLYNILSEKSHKAKSEANKVIKSSEKSKKNFKKKVK